MTKSIRTALAVIASAALLAGCAAGPYYQDAGYGYGYDNYSPSYYSPGYVAPSVGLGITYIDRDARRDWRGDRRYDRDGRREYDGRRDHDGRRDYDARRDYPGSRDEVGRYDRYDWRKDHGQNSGG